MSSSAGSASAARLASLTIRDYRNLARVELEPPADGFVLVGDNGQGKTNLLEAVYYLELLRAVRGARDQDVVRFGESGFHVHANVESDRASEIAIGFERAGKRKRVRIDGVVIDRLSDALGALPAVMFSPTDVELVTGAPAARRRYLDIVLALTSRRYLHALQRYRAALARRNAELRAATRAGASRAPDARISVWEEPLAEHGAVLLAERIAWVSRMADVFARDCDAIGELARVQLRYVSPLADRDDLRAALADALEQKRSLDIKRGLTHAGPHRDDLAIEIESADGIARELRAFGSAGQQRTAAIALRLLESETFRERRGRSPVLLLDDPFAELDERRAARIVSLLKAERAEGQTILAVPRESDIPSGLDGLARLCISGGTVSSWSGGGAST